MYHTNIIGEIGGMRRAGLWELFSMQFFYKCEALVKKKKSLLKYLKTKIKLHEI